MTTLLVANDGGHVMQLHTLAPRLGLGGDHVWVTVPTPQTESLLVGEVVHWVRPAPTRDVRAAAVNAVLVGRLLRRQQVSAAVSTGSSLAVSVLPQLAARRITSYYVESATRVDGPSVSGRLLSVVPGIRMYTQHRSWAEGRWHYGGSVFDGFTAVTGRAVSGVQRVVVSLGTSERYGFRRLVTRLLAILPPDAEVLWQTGSTDVKGLVPSAVTRLPAADLHSAMRRADVVVAHAGTGVALAALGAGKMPVLVPRRPEHVEHVDDHQVQIAGDLARRRLAVVREADRLTMADLLQAASSAVDVAAVRPLFQL